MTHHNPKHEIFVRLLQIVNSKECLWGEMRNLTRTSEYLMIDDYYGRILKKLDVLESYLGPTSEIAELRELVGAQS